MLTQKELKEFLHYNPDTGVFTWLRGRQKAKAGSLAKSKDGRGYITMMINYKAYLGHRLAWFYFYGEWPEEHIDHINHVRDDNRISNLRRVTHQENLKNRTINKNNTSGVSGIRWENDRKKWKAQIGVDGRLTMLGRFIDKFEAICARKSAEIKYNYHYNNGLK